MTDAEKMVCDYMYDFVKANWDKIDLEKCEITRSKNEQLEFVKANISDALWILFEVCNWGMDKRYLEDLFVHKNDDPWFYVIQIGTHYIKIVYTPGEEKAEFTFPKTKTVTYFE